MIRDVIQKYDSYIAAGLGFLGAKVALSFNDVIGGAVGLGSLILVTIKIYKEVRTIKINTKDE